MVNDEYGDLRIRVRDAAREGRATYLPAGARDNAVAMVLIDGEPVGQASTCMTFVRLVGLYSPFSEVRLIPKDAFGGAR
ncbi:MAG TPA: hypothetical protein VK537_07610 [Galbitalea sp.]|nr:hypothetical protein [Galbitalea sp.]